MEKPKLLRLSLVTAALLLTLGASAQFRQTNLVSDGFVDAAHKDSNLVNPWGVAFSPTGPFWISDNGASVSTLYLADGTPFPESHPLVVNLLPAVQSAPTGVVFNGGSGFAITGNGVTKPSGFIFVTEEGSIEGWSGAVDPTNAVITYSDPNNNSVFKGCALAQERVHDQMVDRLYVTNFHTGFVEIFDTSFHMVGKFTDHRVPDGYAPFGIHTIEGLLVVTFAKQDADKHDDVPGPGHGFVDVFSPRGELIRRFASRGALNSPWGVALAPGNFGRASHRLLIGNFGDGRINMYTINGNFKGPLRDRNHDPIENDGLWEIKFGNGGLAGPKNTLFFTAGLNGESDGLFGKLEHTGGDGDGDDDGD